MNREDHQQILAWVSPNTRILDIGCGDGELMLLLRDHRDVRAQGIELDAAKVGRCIGKGLSVIQGDADTDLVDYPDHAFDMVILSQTLQAMHRPRETLRQLGRIAPQSIVAMPNFSYWRGVMQLLLHGRMPVTRHLPVSWYDTPNIHFCAIGDFLDLCELEDFVVLESTCFDTAGRTRPWPITGLGARLLATHASFLLEKSPS